MKKTKYKNDILQTLKQVCDIRPGTPVATHIATALADYTVIEGISDKELYYILEKYRCTIELDISIPHDRDIDDLLREAQDIDNMFNDEEDVY